MAQQTTLSPLALSGRLYGSFSGKSAPSGKGAGPFTKLGLSSAPERRNSTFSGKTGAVPAKGAGPFTRMGTLGTSERLYGDFSGKIEAVPAKGVGPFTRLLAEGIPRQRYGTFSGKEAVIIEPEEPISRGGGSGRIKRRRERELEKEFEDILLREQALREDEEIIMILATMHINGYI